MLLKVIIRESHIDTNATVSHIRTQLSSLDTYLPTIGHDIGKLNDYVTSLHDALLARGEVSNDLLVNLFKGYKSSSDRRFVAYIEKKEEDYEDGTASISPQQLMTLAKNRYEVLVEKGIWNAPSLEEEKIMALESTIKKLQSSKRKAQSNSQGTKKSDKKGANSKNKPLPAWVNEKPKPGEVKTREVDGKVWHYCDHHGRWTHHKADECKKKGMDRKTGRTMAPPTLKSNPKHNSKAVRFAKAMSAIASDEEEEE
jgi:hypothetical protein